MKKRHLSFLLTCACCLMLCVSLTSCPGDDEPDMPIDIEDPVSGTGNNDNKPDGSITREQLKQLVKTTVSITAEYRDYFWIMNIKSTLHTNVKGKITFGFGCGVLNNNEENVMNEADLSTNRNCSISKRVSGDTEIITMKVPFWYYYIFGRNVDDEIATLSDMYYTSYVALLDRGQQYWSQDERALYNDLVKYLNEYELPTKWNFTPSIWVDVDGKSMIVARYQRK